MGARGPKGLSARDWLLGSRPRRLVLEAVLADPGHTWLLKELVELSGVGARGLDAHLRGLEALGVIERDVAGWRAAAPGPPFAVPLQAFLVALGEVSDKVAVDDLLTTNAGDAED